MPAIFLSYRRSDSIESAGRIFDRLTARFSRQQVFKDVDSIPLSVPFPEFLRETLQQTRVVLAVIGPAWLDCRSSSGARRLDDPGDFVRIELETALQLKIPTIPVTVAHAAMPPRELLPESLRGLVERHGRPVRPDPDFHADMDRLIEGLTELVGEVAGPSAPVGRELLRELLDVAQRWHDEIVETAASIAATDDEREARRLEFVYLHTRKFLPKIASIRGVLESREGMASLTAAVDRFLRLVTVPSAPNQSTVLCSPYPRRLAPQFPLGDSWGGRFFDDKPLVVPLPEQAVDTPWGAMACPPCPELHNGLPELQSVLQQISDEVTRLLARG